MSGTTQVQGQPTSFSWQVWALIRKSYTLQVGHGCGTGPLTHTCNTRSTHAHTHTHTRSTHAQHTDRRACSLFPHNPAPHPHPPTHALRCCGCCCCFPLAPPVPAAPVVVCDHLHPAAAPALPGPAARAAKGVLLLLHHEAATHRTSTLRMKEARQPPLLCIMHLVVVLASSQALQSY